MKVYADDKFNFLNIIVFGWIENTVRKGEIAGYQHNIFSFCNYFSQLYSLSHKVSGSSSKMLTRH